MVLVKTSQILHLYDKEIRIEAEHPGMRKERTPWVVRNLVPAPGMNTISYSWLDEHNAESVIRAEAAYLSRLEQPFEWVVGEHDPFPRLRTHLEAGGFRPDEPGPLMVLDVHQAPKDLLNPVTADIRRLTRPEQLADVISVEEQVWGGSFDWITKRMGAHLQVPGYLHLYAAYMDGQPVATAWVYFHENTHFGGLFGGSTLPAYRGRGLYTALLAQRVQDARQRSFRFLTINASPMSRPIVSKHGFQLLTELTDYKVPAAPAEKPKYEHPAG